MKNRCVTAEESIRLEKIFPFLREKGHIISIAGAGGKTSLMYFLAEEFSGRGHNTLVTTTTHIMCPPYFRAQSLDELNKLWQNGSYAVVGKDSDSKKLTAPDRLEELALLSDTVIIEADGAKNMPLKVPEEHEPVIFKKSDIVIGTAGLDSLGKPLKEVCFRAERASELLECDKNHIITAEDIALILSSLKGTMKNTEGRKYYALLNKCDNEKMLESALEIRELLYKNGVKSVITARLKEGKFYE